MKSEINPSHHYRNETIETLTKLSKIYENKSFKDISRGDVTAFLDQLRKRDCGSIAQVDRDI